MRTQREIDATRRVIVGVNDYVGGERSKVPLLEMDAQGYRTQVNRLNEVRRTRDGRAVMQKLGDLKRAASDEKRNLMPLLLDAVSEYRDFAGNDGCIPRRVG